MSIKPETKLGFFGSLLLSKLTQFIFCQKYDLSNITDLNKDGRHISASCHCTKRSRNMQD